MFPIGAAADLTPTGSRSHHGVVSNWEHHHTFRRHIPPMNQGSQVASPVRPSIRHPFPPVHFYCEARNAVTRQPIFAPHSVHPSHGQPHQLWRSTGHTRAPFYGHRGERSLDHGRQSYLPLTAPDYRLPFHMHNCNRRVQTDNRWFLSQPGINRVASLLSPCDM